LGRVRYGLGIVLTEHAPDGQVYATNSCLYIGCGHTARTDLDYEGRRARHLVREGLADVLAWLGEPVGPPPVRERGRALYARLMAAAQ
jgi:hypothetical protein